MQQELILTTNNLRDIITWLKQGFIICLYSNIQKVYYYSRESIAEIKDEKIVYIDISENPGLLGEDEWPYYIKSEGFQEYKSTDKLPTNHQNIYNYKIEFKINFVNK